MIDAVLAGASHAALKADDLRNQPIVARQHDAAAVQQWQQVAIKIGLRRLADFVDPVLMTAMPHDRRRAAGAWQLPAPKNTSAE